MTHPLSRSLTLACTILTVAFLVAGLAGVVRLDAAGGVGDQVSGAGEEAGKTLQEAGEAATTWAAELWRRIDEQRLRNRTSDQIVAWVIMGLLVGGLIQLFGKFNPVTTLLLGLVGAFVGGILANVIQFDLGLGPVLIRYEELLASLAGGVLIVVAARWVASRRPRQD